MDVNDLRWILALPFASAALLAVLPFFAPPVRWTRRLKNDIEIWKGLPEGEEKEQFEKAVRLIARRLHAYRFDVRRIDKVFPWAGTVLFALAVGSAAMWGFAVDGPADWILVVLGFFTGLLSIFAALGGRSNWIVPAEIAKDFERGEVEHLRKVEKSRAVRSEARRRLRNIRKTSGTATSTGGNR